MAQIDLHVHPFLGRNDGNTIVDVVNAMERQNLDIVALESLDSSIYPQVLSETRRFYPASIIEPEGIRLPDGRYILNAREYNTKENLHILTVGYSMDDATPKTEIRKIIDNGLKNGSLVNLDHSHVDNIRTRTAGHISDELEYELTNICREYSGQITLEWNGYCIPWMRQMLKYGLNIAGIETKYHDVNKKTEELSESLKREGYNIPVISVTDLHGRTKKDLQHMGTARIVTDIKGFTPREVIDSMRENIFSRNYENFKRYVGFVHLLSTFCLPIILPRIYTNPRA